jgi:hypothetical protein
VAGNKEVSAYELSSQKGDKFGGTGPGVPRSPQLVITLHQWTRSRVLTRKWIYVVHMRSRFHARIVVWIKAPVTDNHDNVFLSARLSSDTCLVRVCTVARSVKGAIGLKERDSQNFC